MVVPRGSVSARAVSVILWALMLSLGVPPTIAKTRTPRVCAPDNAQRVAVVDGVRFYRFGADWFACRGRQGTRTRLTGAGVYSVLSGPRALAVRGNRVAFAYNVYDDGPDFGEVAYTYVASTTLGVGVEPNTLPGNPTAVGPNGESNSPTQQYNSGAVGSLAIARGGRTVWITCPGGSRNDRCVAGQRTVYLAASADQDERRLPQQRLAVGRGIGSRSLRVSADGATVSWTRDGRRVSTTLPP